MKAENIAENRQKIKRHFSTAKRDAAGKVIRSYKGIDIKEVYERKPLAYKMSKRIFDIIVSAIALVVLSPLFLGVAIAIKHEDGGPVFFSGQRWGKDFKYFPMHKFRSMRVDAEKMTNNIVHENEKNGMAFKLKNDPRVTKVGKFLRWTSIDELPQLLNVLVGEMSLVGPRPIQTITTDGDPYDLQRWCVKPEITCIWQVDGRDEIEWDEWVEMDLQYITEMSASEDLKLLFATVGAVLSRRGAD